MCGTLHLLQTQCSWAHNKLPGFFFFTSNHREAFHFVWTYLCTQAEVGQWVRFFSHLFTVFWGGAFSLSNSSFSENITTLSATTKEKAHRITGVFRIRKPRDTQKTSVTIRHQVCYSTWCRDTLFTKQTQKYHRQKFVTNTQVIDKPQTKKKSAPIHFCQLFLTASNEQFLIHIGIN